MSVKWIIRGVKVALIAFMFWYGFWIGCATFLVMVVLSIVKYRKTILGLQFEIISLLVATGKWMTVSEIIQGVGERRCMAAGRDPNNISSTELFGYHPDFGDTFMLTHRMSEVGSLMHRYRIKKDGPWSQEEKICEFAIGPKRKWPKEASTWFNIGKKLQLPV